MTVSIGGGGSANLRVCLAQHHYGCSRHRSSREIAHCTRYRAPPKNGQIHDQVLARNAHKVVELPQPAGVRIYS